MQKVWHMYKNILIAGGAALFLGGVGFAGYHFFKEKPTSHNMTIAVVDFVRLSTESKTFQAINSHWENQHSESGRMIFNSDNELREEYREIREKEKRTTKPDAALIAKKQAFEKKVVQLEQLVQHRKNELNTERQDLHERLNAKIKEILESLAASKNISLIINRAMGEDVPIILFARQTLDITDKVIQKLDEARHEFDVPS